MVKYKLIKKYPGSPELGTELLYCKVWNLYTDGKWAFSEEKIKNFPEYWEEIIEKEYEILSICTNSYFGITTSEVDIDAYLSCSKSTNKWTIDSIKRLSDGEIFTIGDIINFKSSGLPITEIIINSSWQGGIVFRNGNSNGIAISYAEKVKKPKPLFTTYDGVDIYENDEYFVLHKTCWFINKTRATNYTKGTDITYLYFSSKEEAEKYLILNKPVLTLNDVYRNVPSGVTFNFADLRKLVEDKIKFKE